MIGGSLLLGIAWLASPEVLGLGKETIQRALEGGTIVWALILGENTRHRFNPQYCGKRGIVLPICFIGATTGSALGWLLGYDPSLLAALGLTGLLVGAINTPITAMILVLELFALASGPYLLLNCTIAFLLSGHRSAIPTQLLQFTKAPALQASINQEIGELEIMKTDTQKKIKEINKQTRKDQLKKDDNFFESNG